jgi:hypothetical protein
MPSRFRFVVLIVCALAPRGVLAQPPAAATPATSPLAIHIGDIDLRLGGFFDAVGVFRSTNVGSGLGTTYATIPFENTPQGNLNEARLSAQSTRINLLLTTTLGEAAVKGFLETDFLGATRGSLQLIGQYSYVTRSPWSVPAGTPASARVHMVYVSVRYVLP